jgi:hypothetical protein
MNWLPKAIKVVSDDIGRPRARITPPTEANVVRVRIQMQLTFRSHCSSRWNNYRSSWQSWLMRRLEFSSVSTCFLSTRTPRLRRTVSGHGDQKPCTGKKNEPDDKDECKRSFPISTCDHHLTGFLLLNGEYILDDVSHDRHAYAPRLTLS